MICYLPVSMSSSVTVGRFLPVFIVSSASDSSGTYLTLKVGLVPEETAHKYLDDIRPTTKTYNCV